MGRLFIVLFLVSLILVSPGLVHRARGQNDVSKLYVSPLKSSYSYSSTFKVAVGLNLSSTDGITGYDVILRSNFYNNTYLNPATPVLNPLSIQPGNVFQGRNNATYANCVNGTGQGCDPTKGDGPGAVHSVMTVLGDPVPGGQSVTLFIVTYTVVGTGVTLFDFTNDNVTYDPTIPGYGPNNLIVLHLDYDGVFSNSGLVAFFNVASPAIRLVGVPVSIDASGSFNSDGSRITGYQWDFGDGGRGSGGPTVPHVYDRTGSYSVSLNVTDGKAWRSIVRTLIVSSSLGALRLFPVPVAANKASFQGNITVTLYNVTNSGSTLFGSLVKPPQSAWVLFTGLKAGQYRVDFSGVGVTPSSKTEIITAGWTAWDTIYIPVTVLVPPSSPDYILTLLLGVVGAGIVLGAVAILRRRRSVGKPAKPVNSKGRKG